MATQQVMGIRVARAALADRVHLAQGDEDALHTVLMRDNQPCGVLVSMAWRRSAITALGDIGDLTQVPIVAITTLRRSLGDYVGKHAVIAKHNDLIAALVPWDFYLRAAKALGEPVTL